MGGLGGVLGGIFGGGGPRRWTRRREPAPADVAATRRIDADERRPRRTCSAGCRRRARARRPTRGSGRAPTSLSTRPTCARRSTTRSSTGSRSSWVSRRTRRPKRLLRSSPGRGRPGYAGGRAARRRRARPEVRQAPRAGERRAVTSASSRSRSRRRGAGAAWWLPHPLRPVNEWPHPHDACVRVVDLEPGLLEAREELDRRALEVRRAVAGRSTIVTPCCWIVTSSSTGPALKPSPYWKPEQPPPWIATRRTEALPVGVLGHQLTDLVRGRRRQRNEVGGVLDDCHRK